MNNAIDLFGNERPAKVGRSTPAIALDLFSAAAEKKAMQSGRPVSQERTELLAPKAEPWTPGTCEHCDRPLALASGGTYGCIRCE